MVGKHILDRPWAVWHTEGEPNPFILSTHRDLVWATKIAAAMNASLQMPGEDLPSVFVVRKRDGRIRHDLDPKPGEPSTSNVDSGTGRQ